MKTTTDTLDAALEARELNYVKTVNLYRRYSTGSAYAHDATAVDLLPYLNTCSKINWKLDTNRLNEWKTSNVTLVLNNEANVWDETNASGNWASKLAYRSKVVIQAGVKSEGGDTETLRTFTGLIVKPVSLQSQTDGKPIAVIVVTGYEIALRLTPADGYSLRPEWPRNQETNADAPYNNSTIKKTGAAWGVNAYQNMMVRIYSGTGRGQERLISSNTADTLTITPVWTTNPDATSDFEILGEHIGTGDAGGTTAFTTVQPGVGKIPYVWIDGVKQVEGTDYEVRQLNEKSTGGKVEFTTAPGIGEIVTADYIYWHQDILPRLAVEKLLEEAGFSSSEYDVAPVYMPNNARVLWTQDTEAHFTAGDASFQDVSATAESGYLRLVKPATFDRITGAANFDDDDIETDDWATSDSIDLTVTEAGWVKLEVKIDFKGTYGYDAKMTETMLRRCAHDYLVCEVDQSANDADWDGFASVEDFTISYSSKYGAGFLKWNSSALIYVYVSTPKRYVKLRLQYRKNRELIYKPKVDYVDTFIGLAGWAISDSKDCGASLAQFGKFTSPGLSLDPNYRGEVKFYTSSAPDDSGSPGAWDGWEEVVRGGSVMSAVTDRQWIRTKTEIISTVPSTQSQYPKVDKIQVEYYSETFDISLLDLTDLSVWDAIIQIAKLVDYEVGVTAQGKFFFRPKRTDVDEQDFDVSESTNLKRVIEKRYDWKRMRNVIEVQYGKYIKRISPITEFEDFPHSVDKYGEQRFSISGGNLMAPSDHDLATGLAQQMFGKYDEDNAFVSYKYPDPKEYVRIETKCLFQLDLGDIIHITRTYPGTSGNKFIGGTGAGTLFLVMGITLDIMNWTMEIEGLEPY